MSTARALYNEVDKYAAQWLRNLIEAGLIAPGDVAECSIEDLTPNDLRPYNQVHFYAGIGVWSYSLRQAGWPDSRPCWTFSEPCQPFSAAGKRGGTADERYLRPATHHLVRVCRPPVCFGEQVASKDGLGWLDTLQADMEGEGYAIGAFDTCSAGHGVEWEASQAGEWLRRAIHDCDDPWIKAQLGDFADFAGGNFSEGGHHIRQRLRFVAERVADADGLRQSRVGGSWQDGTAEYFGTIRMGDTDNPGLPQQRCNTGIPPETNGAPARQGIERASASTGGLADANGGQPRQAWAVQSGGQHGQQQKDCRTDAGRSGADARNSDGRTADWLFCRDGKWRATRPGTLPLASNAASRVGRLRAYGNAVDAEATIQFIEAYLAVEAERFRLTEVSLLSAGEGVFS